MNVMNALSTRMGKTGLAIKKHSPEILIVTGVIGVVTSAVLACKATTKIGDILEEHERLAEMARNEEGEEQKKKMTTMVYAHTAGSLAKLYAPAVALGVVSLGCIIGSNQILRKRNMALAASAAALNKGWQEYRQRVVDRFGDEVEKQIYYNMQPEEIEETVTDDKGKEKKVKKTVGVADPKSSPFARFFTKGNINWKNDDDWNKTFISMRQSYLNDMLRAKGFLTLNEAYTALGFAETKEGMVHGWLIDPSKPTGFNYVNLSVTETYLPGELGKMERAIAVDFNVDGNIYEEMV